MGKVCEICGRGTKSGNSRSHSNIQTKRTVKPNIQNKKIEGKKMNICTSCLKTKNK